MAPERPVTPPCMMAARSAPSSPTLNHQNHQNHHQMNHQSSPTASTILHHQQTPNRNNGQMVIRRNYSGDDDLSDDMEDEERSRDGTSGARNTPDDDLTSLSWLHDRNLLRGINLGTSTPSTRPSIIQQQQQQSSRNNYHQHHNSSTTNNSINNSTNNTDCASSTGESPTSDFEDNSYVSEDNNTRNSSSDQSSSVAGNNNSVSSKNHNLDMSYEYQRSNASCNRNGSGANSDYGSSNNHNHHSQIRSLKSSPTKHKHPSTLPYDPLVHTTSKPPYSFSSLIFMAIEDSNAKALPVKEIYLWIVSHFPYFRDAPTGWKNSVRHNLSLNKCFQKLEKAPNLGKGSLWMVDERFRPNLLQALTRSPFHACSTLEPQQLQQNNASRPKAVRSPAKDKLSSNVPNPDLFPYLSRRLAAADQHPDDAQQQQQQQQSSNYQQHGNVTSPEPMQLWTAEEFEEANAAAVMVALKHGRLGQPGGVPIITSSPSEDHTYSSSLGGAKQTPPQQQTTPVASRRRHADAVHSPDAAYESDDSRSFTDLEEQRRLAEGADALLNLAGIRRQSLSETSNNLWDTTTTYHLHITENPTDRFNDNNDRFNDTNDRNNDNSRENKDTELNNRAKFKPRMLRRPKRRISATGNVDGKYYLGRSNVSKFYSAESKRIRVDKY